MANTARPTQYPRQTSQALQRQTRERQFAKRAPGSSAILELPKSIQNLYTVLIVVYALLILAASLELSPIVIVCNFFWILVVSYPIVFYRKGWGIEHPLVLLAILNSISLVLRQTYGLISGLPYHVALPSYSRQQLDQVYCYGTLIQCLSLIMIYVGFMLSAGIKPFGYFQNRVTRRRIIILVLAITIVGCLALMLMVAISGDFTQHLKNIVRGSNARSFTKDVGGVGPLAMLVNLIGVAGVLSITSRQPRWFIVCVCILALGTLYLTEGRRSAVIYPMVLFLYAWAIVNRKIPLVVTSFVIALAFFVLAAGSAFRSSNFGTGSSITFAELSNLTPTKVVKKASEELQDRSNAASPIYAIVARVPSEVDLLYGKGYLGYLNLFVPRFFWKEKPRGIDYQSGMTFFGVNWGMPPGSVGQAFWEFHVAGVVIVFFLFGILKRWFYNSLKANQLSYASLALYLTAMFYIEPDQNSFRNTVFVLFPMIICLVLWGGFRLRLAGER